MKTNSKQSENQLIADFLGWKRTEHGEYMVPNTYPLEFMDTGETECTCDSMSFHDRWDWLVPVIQKIYDTPVDRFGGRGHSVVGEITMHLSEANLIRTYNSVILFCKWLNPPSK